MNTAGKLAAFAAVAAVGFGGAAAVGAAVGPIDVGGGAGHNAHSTSAEATNDVPRGLAVAESGYRLVINNGPDGGETVPHMHVHLLGQRPMTWPPG